MDYCKHTDCFGDNLRETEEKVVDVKMVQVVPSKLGFAAVVIVLYTTVVYEVD